VAITFVNDSATISTTEYSLPADTTTGVPTSQTDDCLLQGWIDFGALVAGDQYEWKFYEKVNGSGATQRVIATGYATGAQVGPVVIPTFIVGEGWDITVKKLTGTDRAIGWSLRKVT
jgi:hypothetical protein